MLNDIENMFFQMSLPNQEVLDYKGTCLNISLTIETFKYAQNRFENSKKMHTNLWENIDTNVH